MSSFNDYRDLQIVNSPTGDGGIVLNDNFQTIADMLRVKTITDKTNGVASPYTILATESGTIFTNRGAIAEVHFDLPAAAAGLFYEFAVVDADGMQVNAQAGDTIRIGSNVTAAGGNVSTTDIGAALRLVALDGSEWVMVPFGTSFS